MNRLQTSGTVAALAWLVLSFLALPAFAVIPVSFTDTRYLSLPQEHLSLQHWRTFLSSREWLGSIWQSLWIAAVSTVMAVTAGTLCAVGCWRIASRASERVRSAMILPLAVPTIVYALGIYRLYVALDLVGTGLGVVLAHAVTGLPYVVLTVSASLSNLDPAARTGRARAGRVGRPDAPPCDRAQHRAGRAVRRDLCFHPFLGRADRGHLHRRTGALHPAAPHVGRHQRQSRSRHRRGGDRHDPVYLAGSHCGTFAEGKAGAKSPVH